MSREGDKILARWYVVMGLYEALKVNLPLRVAWVGMEPKYRQALIDLMVTAGATPYDDDTVDAIERQMVKGKI